MRLETLAVHAGATVDAETGALAPPLHLSTTYEHAPDGSMPHGLIYQRTDHPTQQRFEQALAALEHGMRALFFGSGMGAGTALLQSLPTGSHVLFPDDVYHGYRHLAREYSARWNLRCDFADLSDIASARAALTPLTRLIWAETPSNPLLKISDIAALAELAHARGARLLVDNTFATPVLQQPLALGADIVLHSVTKYIGGHSDTMGGALVFGADLDALAEQVFRTRAAVGLHGAPLAAWLALRGLHSLPARMDWHCRNAFAVAQALGAHPAVTHVHYPGLPTHPGHAVAAQQMRDFGGMVSFELGGGRDAALACAGRLELFINATSLGGCESLVEHRASIEGPEPTSPQGLLRLSVGLEHPDDLVGDLMQALSG
ncbi:MAG: trans-sulfuration enzyme family protein [Metallibacterium sp.]